MIFLVANLGNFIFHESLEIDKLEGADFKYDNNFSKYFCNKSPK